MRDPNYSCEADAEKEPSEIKEDVDFIVVKIAGGITINEVSIAPEEVVQKIFEDIGEQNRDSVDEVAALV